jgi:hypothetical protein
MLLYITHNLALGTSEGTNATLDELSGTLVLMTGKKKE